MKYRLRKLREGTKVVHGAPIIQMDMYLPLDKEDYEFLKKMHELEISVRGRFLLGSKIIGFFDNGVKSI